MDSGRFFVACPGLGFRVLVRWLVVARVFPRHFRATRRLQSFVAMRSFEVADLVAICCSLSKCHFGNLVYCDLSLRLSSSCFLFFIVFSLKSCFCFVWGVFTANCVPRFSLIWFRKTPKLLLYRLSFNSFPVIICFQLSRRGLMLHRVADSILLVFLQNVKRRVEERRSHFASR